MLRLTYILLGLAISLVEGNEAGTAQECKEEEFRCVNSGQCLASEVVCDSVDNCGDNSDESACVTTPSTPTTTSPTVTTTSTPTTTSHTGTALECKEEEFRCVNSGQCLASEVVCDSVDNCGDNSDESACVTTPSTTTTTSPKVTTTSTPTTTSHTGTAQECKEEEFRCVNSGQCLASEVVCDSVDNCGDNSDESACVTTPSTPTTTSPTVTTTSTPTIKSHTVTTITAPTTTAYTGCKSGEFLCQRGGCIPSSKRCDSNQDCFEYDDYSDEENCSGTAQECKEEEFRCVNSGQCLASEVVCDSVDNCGDNSDESACVTTPSTPTTTSPTVTTTSTPTTTSHTVTTITAPPQQHIQECIYSATFTNLQNEYSCKCSPGWQGNNCDQDINECAQNPCKNGATCNDLQNEYSCMCTPGWQGKNCDQDLDECAPAPCKNGATCTDLQNAYSCTCSPGWQDNNCDQVHHQALSAIVVTGCTISMVGLLATVVTYVYFWRFVKSARATLLINLCAVVFIVYLIFLIGIEGTENMTSCTAVAVLLHYVYLVAFFVMLAEGGMIALMVLRPFGYNNVLLGFLAAAYGIPLIIVAISMGATRLIGYGNERLMESGLFWAFAGPVLTIVATNTIIMVLVLKKLFGVNVLATTDVEKIKTGVRSVCILLPVLGITWLFCIFAVNKDTFVFQFLFAICNSLQGILIFLVQCVFERKVCDAVRQARIPWLTAATERRTGEAEMQSMEKSASPKASASTSNIYN